MFWYSGCSYKGTCKFIKLNKFFSVITGITKFAALFATGGLATLTIKTIKHVVSIIRGLTSVIQGLLTKRRELVEAYESPILRKSMITKATK